MANRTRVEGLARLKAHIARLTPEARKEMADLNADTARRFANAVRVDLPRGDPAHGHLEDTLHWRKGETDTGYLVSVGGPGQPYPLHLEVGHKAPDGSHVPPTPFWYANRRAAVKKHKAARRKLLRTIVIDVAN